MTSLVEPRRVVPRRRDAGNPVVWLELQLGEGVRAEALRTRIVFELFADVAPREAENVRCLCTGERGKVRRGGVVTQSPAGVSGDGWQP